MKSTQKVTNIVSQLPTYSDKDTNNLVKLPTYPATLDLHCSSNI